MSRITSHARIDESRLNFCEAFEEEDPKDHGFKRKRRSSLFRCVDTADPVFRSVE